MVEPPSSLRPRDMRWCPTSRSTSVAAIPDRSLELHPDFVSVTLSVTPFGYRTHLFLPIGYAITSRFSSITPSSHLGYILVGCLSYSSGYTLGTLRIQANKTTEFSLWRCFVIAIIWSCIRVKSDRFVCV